VPLVEVAEHLAVLRSEGARLAAAVTAAGPDAAVPSCPGWTVRDLVRHLGGVHRWATRIVADRRRQPWNPDLAEVAGPWPDDTALVGWLAEGHAALIDTLAAAGPDLDCWTFLRAPTPLAMWSRRQAHETVIHRVDAELAAQVPTARREDLPAPVAADGIDELLSCFITRRTGQLRADRPTTLLVACTDAPGEWLVTISDQPVRTGPPGPAPDSTLRGPATQLYLALWNRRSTDGLVADGAPWVRDLFSDRVRVRW